MPTLLEIYNQGQKNRDRIALLYFNRDKQILLHPPSPMSMFDSENVFIIVFIIE